MLAVSCCPSAVTTCADNRLSQVGPCLRAIHPRPPPSVSPARPVFETLPVGVARPNSCVARSRFAEQNARLRASGAGVGIDLDGLHAGEIDHETVVAHSVAGDVVPATADSEGKSALAREAHRLNHIALMRAASDQRGPAVDHPVPDLPGVVVPRVTWCDQFPAEDTLQALDGAPGGFVRSTWFASSPGALVNCPSAPSRTSEGST